VDPSLARTIWHRLETLNAVSYFSPECRDAPTLLGLRGFWMGYFACRAAPMGPVPASVVEATFANFHPARVRRAIPDAWLIASPAAVLEARADSAAAALRRLLGDEPAERLAAAARPTLDAAVERADPVARPLFAANRELARSADPVAALWQAATTMREHRGDGHVALLAAAGLDGCEVHVVFAAAEGQPPALYLDSRGWSPEDWAAAVERLRGRGLLAADGSLSPAGAAVRDGIERRTDELAWAAWSRAGDDAVGHLLEVLAPAAERVAASGELRYPNPMGLPRELPSRPS
jgi:hypothetical protein